jgi:hypothetical protein
MNEEREYALQAWEAPVTVDTSYNNNFTSEADEFVNMVWSIPDSTEDRLRAHRTGRALNISSAITTNLNPRINLNMTYKDLIPNIEEVKKELTIKILKDRAKAILKGGIKSNPSYKKVVKGDCDILKQILKEFAELKKSKPSIVSTTSAEKVYKTERNKLLQLQWKNHQNRNGRI